MSFDGRREGEERVAGAAPNEAPDRDAASLRASGAAQSLSACLARLRDLRDVLAELEGRSTEVSEQVAALQQRLLDRLRLLPQVAALPEAVARRLATLQCRACVLLLPAERALGTVRMLTPTTALVLAEADCPGCGRRLRGTYRLQEDGSVMVPARADGGGPWQRLVLADLPSLHRHARLRALARRLGRSARAVRLRWQSLRESLTGRARSQRR